MKKTRVLLADDHAMICEGLTKLLESQYEVVGTVMNGSSLLQAVETLKPEVVVLDVRMPMLNGLEAARELKKRAPHLKLVFFTMVADSYVAAEALRAGALCYLLKTSSGAELLQALEQAMKGISYVTPQIGREIEARYIREPKVVERPKELTVRQREVLQMLAEGSSMKEIAFTLHIELRTVRFHKYRLMEELEIATNAGLVMYAIKHGMVSLA